MPPTVVVYLSFADLWMVLIPLVAFRIFEVNVGIESRRDLFHLVLFGVIINNFVTATWGSLSLAMGGVIGWNQVMTAFLPWFVGNAITTIIIVPLVLHHLTNRVSRSKVFVKTYWY
jgi:integral membrane sensor domain MASE1